MAQWHKRTTVSKLEGWRLDEWNVSPLRHDSLNIPYLNFPRSCNAAWRGVEFRDSTRIVSKTDGKWGNATVLTLGPYIPLPFLLCAGYSVNSKIGLDSKTNK